MLRGVKKMRELVTKKLDLLMSMIMTLYVRHKIFHILHEMMMKYKLLLLLLMLILQIQGLVIDLGFKVKLVRMDQKKKKIACRRCFNYKNNQGFLT